MVFLTIGVGSAHAQSGSTTWKAFLAAEEVPEGGPAGVAQDRLDLEKVLLESGWVGVGGPPPQAQLPLAAYWRTFLADVQQNDDVLIYLAGSAYVDQRGIYLITGAESFDLVQFVRDLRGKGADEVAILLDACLELRGGASRLPWPEDLVDERTLFAVSSPLGGTTPDGVDAPTWTHSLIGGLVGGETNLVQAVLRADGGRNDVLEGQLRVIDVILPEGFTLLARADLPPGMVAQDETVKVIATGLGRTFNSDLPELYGTSHRSSGGPVLEADRPCRFVDGVQLTERVDSSVLVDAMVQCLRASAEGGVDPQIGLGSGASVSKAAEDARTRAIRKILMSEADDLLTPEGEQTLQRMWVPVNPYFGYVDYGESGRIWCAFALEEPLDPAAYAVEARCGRAWEEPRR